MKVLIGLAAVFALAQSFTFSTDLCPADKERECITDVNGAIDRCDQAAREKGKDSKADIECIQYTLAIQKDCWPCICQIAKDSDIKIKGCPE